VDCRVPVVLVVGGPGVGKTAVAAATLHDAFTFKHMRVCAFCAFWRARFRLICLSNLVRWN